MSRSKKAKTRQSRQAGKGSTLINLKVSDSDRRALNAAAKKYANGNLSAWLRYAGAAFRPGKIAA